MKRRITCYCEHDFEAELPEEADCAASPEVEGDILSGAFMSLRCPECGKLLKPEFPFRYRDSGRKVDIFLLPELDRGAYLRGSLENVPADVERVVIGFPELQEKIRVVNAKLDDRVVEVLKFHLYQKASEQHAEKEIRIYFASRGGGALTFDVHGVHQDEVGVVRVPEHTATRVEDELPKTLRQKKYREFLRGPYISYSTVSLSEQAE